jgi:hypothetical protein
VRPTVDRGEMVRRGDGGTVSAAGGMQTLGGGSGGRGG